MARLITEPWDAEDVLLMPSGATGSAFNPTPVVDFPASFTAANEYRGFTVSPALAVSFDGFYIYINTNNADITEPFYALTNSGTVEMHLVRDNTTALLNLYQGGTFAGTFINLAGRTLLGTGIHPLAQGSHYHVQVGFDSGAGTIEIRIDGSQDILVAGLTLGTYFTTQFRSVQLSGNQSYLFDSYYKNDDQGGVEDTFGGVIRMVSMVPVADGFYTAWSDDPVTGVLFNHINETPYDGDSSILFSNTNTQKFSVDPGAHGLTAPADIKAVSARWVCRKVSDGQVTPFFRIGVTDYPMGSAQDLGTDYMVVFDRRRQNPATAADWALADTFEVGLEANI